MLFLGFYEVQLGQFGPARRRAESVLRESKRLNDQGLKYQAFRLAHFLASYSGDERTRTDAFAGLKTNPSPALSAFLAEGEGTASLMQGDWPAASHHFAEAVRVLEEIGQMDQRALVETRLAYVYHKLGKRDEANRAYERADGFFKSGGYPRYSAIHSIVGIGSGKQSNGQEIGAVCRDLGAEHRYLDLAVWGSEILASAPQSEKSECRRTILRAVQTISDSFVGPAHRRQFLSLLRVTELLHMLRA